jgi:thioesterase domain-containing protein/acyl carrier protein
VEEILVETWSQLLKVNKIGRHDHFFELGGHSLLAVQLVSMLKRKGIEVPVAALFSFPTIERLASHIEGKSSIILQDSAIPIRTGGNSTPLFLVHDGLGEVLYGPPLARHIDADIPVYGLAGGPLSAAPLTTMYEQARRFITFIRAVQPVGPYRVAGWSYGGALAYEIASQLIGDDEKVVFLGMIDSEDVFRTVSNDLDSVDDRQMLLQIVLQNAANPALKARLSSLAMISRFELLAMKCQEEKLLPELMSVEDIRRYLVRHRVYLNAMYDYYPKPIHIPIYYFRAMDEQSIEIPLDEWEKVLPEHQIRVITVPGNHRSMMEAPHIETLGKSLSDAIRRAGSAGQVDPNEHSGVQCPVK